MCVHLISFSSVAAVCIFRKSELYKLFFIINHLFFLFFICGKSFAHCLSRAKETTEAKIFSHEETVWERNTNRNSKKKVSDSTGNQEPSRRREEETLEGVSPFITSVVKDKKEKQNFVVV